MLAAVQELQDNLPSWLYRADDFDPDMDRRVSAHFLEISRQERPRHRKEPWLVRIKNDDAPQWQGPARPLAESFRLLEQQLGDAAADHATAN
jgi:hypothetical protein